MATTPTTKSLLDGFSMADDYIAIKPKDKNDLSPELGRFALRTFGKIIASSKAHEIGMEVIFDGSQGTSLEDSDIQIVPTKAVLAYKRRSDK